MTTENEDRLVLTVMEAAKLLRLSRGLAYEGVRLGQIPSIHTGRRILIPRAALQRLLDGELSSIPGNQESPGVDPTEARDRSRVVTRNMQVQ